MVHNDVSFDPKTFHDVVILRSNGIPTYNLTSVVDDADLGITHIIRGDDHLSNTAVQINLFNSLGYDIPMVQVTRDVRHLEVCGSPFLKVAQEAVEGQRCKEVEWFLESYGEALQTYDLQSLDPGRALEETALLALESSGENIFSGLSREELNQLRGHAYPLKFEAGDHIIRKEERREEMFIVEEGSVSVERGSPGLKPIVLGRGQVFGEVSLLTATGRTADAIAVEDGRILVLTRQTVIRLMKKTPELMSTLLFNIGRILAGRFVEINDTLNKESNHG